MSINATGNVGSGNVYGCSFVENPPGTDERNSKEELLGKRFVWAGNASSTTDEAPMLIRAAVDAGKNLEDGVRVYGNIPHLLRAEQVWRYYLPGIRFNFIGKESFEEDDDPENPMIAQRYWQVWAVANLIGLVFYNLLGVEHFAKKNHRQITSR